MQLQIPLTLKVFDSVFKENLAIALLQNWRLRVWQELQKQWFCISGWLFHHYFFLANLDFLFIQDQREWKELKLLLRPCKLSFPSFPQCLEGILHTGCSHCKVLGPPRQSGYPLLLHADLMGWGVAWQAQTPALTFPGYQCRHWALLHLSHQSLEPSPLQITSTRLRHAAARCKKPILQRLQRACSSSQHDCCSLISACVLLSRRKVLWWKFLTRDVLSPNSERQRLFGIQSSTSVDSRTPVLYFTVTP